MCTACQQRLATTATRQRGSHAWPTLSSDHVENLSVHSSIHALSRNTVLVAARRIVAAVAPPLAVLITTVHVKFFTTILEGDDPSNGAEDRPHDAPPDPLLPVYMLVYVLAMAACSFIRTIDVTLLSVQGTWHAARWTGYVIRPKHNV